MGDTAVPEPRPAVERMKGLLRSTLRITVPDGRIFIGTFVGTDQPLNLILINAEEFRDENPQGRFVGQVLIPWKLATKVEAHGYEAASDAGSEDLSKRIRDDMYM